MHRTIAPLLLLVSTTSAAGTLRIEPAEIELVDSLDRQRVLVVVVEGERITDHTGDARLSLVGDVAELRDDGSVVPLRNGTGRLIAEVAGQRAEVPIRVSGLETELTPNFEEHVQPILTRLGCNAGACHGKQRGQNGFQLSLLAFDHDFDYEAVALEGLGRRVFPAVPERSLLLQKGTAELPHGGGVRLPLGSVYYDVLHDWVGAGMPRAAADAATLERIEVWPSERSLAPHEEQRLLVTAVLTDGTRRDVTHLAAFESNESVIADVDEHGAITAGPLPGEATIMARYMNHFATTQVVLPLAGEVADSTYQGLPVHNFIDELVWQKLAKLGITPSDVCDDATFLRRVHTDLIGRLPTPDETRAFLANTDPDKRKKIVDELLDRPEYADFWANKWADLLRPNPYRVGIKAVWNLDAWLRDAFRRNMPYDEFVREIVTAQGSTFRHGPAVVFRDRRSPDEVTTMVSQLFLGIRLECAKCHHHPFEVWGQDDFYHFAAYFSNIERKGTGLSPPISGSEEVMYVGNGKPSVPHPRTGAALPPKPLFDVSGIDADTPLAEDPRRDLANWMTSPDNPYFAQVAVNRIWGDVMARGIVEPVDDLRATNPPTNPELLTRLADEFRTSMGYDLKELLRTITTSYVYQLASEPNDRNAGDLQNYSRHYRQRLRAEVLLDAIVDITGMPQDFDAMPEDSRAVEIWTHRADSLFLDTFGRPDPNQDPPCERTTETTVTQALHLLNSPQLYAKVTSDEGRAAKLAADEQKSVDDIIEEVYLLVYSRLPNASELEIAKRHYAAHGDDRRKPTEDLLWALLNTAEFVFEN